MKSVLRKLVKLAGLEGARSNKILAEQIRAIDPNSYLSEGKIVSCGLRIDPRSQKWILDSIPMLLDLLNDQGFSFVSEQDSLLAKRGTTAFRVISHLEVGIIFDIYARGVYRLLCQEPVLLIDVGANIGISAVYSAIELGAEVHGFELVPSVATRASDHVIENRLTEQVWMYPYGLGHSDATIQVSFDEHLTGATSLHMATQGGTKVECNIKGVECLRPILSNSDRRKFMKLDCEGAEYEILESLKESGLLNEFSGFLLEYHEISSAKDRRWLEVFLTANGFDVHSFLKPGFNHEMMYAFRR